MRISEKTTLLSTILRVANTYRYKCDVGRRSTYDDIMQLFAKSTNNSRLQRTGTSIHRLTASPLFSVSSDLTTPQSFDELGYLGSY